MFKTDENRPMETRILGWCVSSFSSEWKFGYFMNFEGKIYFKHEGQGPVFEEHEVPYWMPEPPDAE